MSNKSFSMSMTKKMDPKVTAMPPRTSLKLSVRYWTRRNSSIVGANVAVGTNVGANVRVGTGVTVGGTLIDGTGVGRRVFGIGTGAGVYALGASVSVAKIRAPSSVVTRKRPSSSATTVAPSATWAARSSARTSSSSTKRSGPFMNPAPRRSRARCGATKCPTDAIRGSPRKKQ